MSAQTAAAIAERAIRGDVESGFQTPARVYGADFVLLSGSDGVARTTRLASGSGTSRRTERLASRTA